jgi:type I restriction enzyme, R subunit
VAQELMDKLVEQQHILGNLRDRASSQAQMKVAIIDQLLAGMPDYYSNEDIEARADVVFQYVQQQIQYATVH